jgi:hypothetical protein
MNKNTPTAKGVRTFIQAVPGFFIGLALTVWAVPGVREAVFNYMQHEGMALLALLFSGAFFTGLISFFQNRVEDRGTAK